MYSDATNEALQRLRDSRTIQGVTKTREENWCFKCGACATSDRRIFGTAEEIVSRLRITPLGLTQLSAAAFGSALQGKDSFIGGSMIRCTCTLVGISPISFSAPIQSVKDTNETNEAFEERSWRERIHVNKDGIAFIPPMALKNCLSEVAKYLSESVPGKGKSTYTKHFEAGISVIEPLLLGVKADKIDGERLFVPSSGKRGDGKRVWKTFPYLPEWRASAEIIVLDQVCMSIPKGKTETKVQEYLSFAGQFIGMGRFRPRNNGYYGRFSVEDFRCEDIRKVA